MTTYKGNKVYVALDVSSGNVLVTSSSSNGQTSYSDGAGHSLVTTIFTFSCTGFISIADAGTTYTWETNSSNNTVMVAGTPDTSSAILLLPSTAASSSSVSSSNSTLSRRNDPYTEGAIGRCPNNPANLISRPFPNARTMQYNGCGSGSTAEWIPQFNFGQCCDMHDYCYDNCQGGQVELCNNQYCAPGYWEGCNSAFKDCMMDTACTYFSWFWHPIERAGCELAAEFYAGVVTTYLGANAFRDATSERCKCYCSNGQSLCNGGCDTNFYGNDNNNCGGCNWQCPTQYDFQCESGSCVCVADTQNDSNNCGNCGWQCPYKTHCSKGGCVCNDDQCGNLCVDFQSHPRNCGSCGNVCASGYCFEGACYEPPTQVAGAPVCYATDAVKNGGFGMRIVLHTNHIFVADLSR